MADAPAEMPAAVDVLVVGAGPAGMAAVAALHGRGLSVLWIDQRDRCGGAIHRQPANGADAAFAPRPARAQWRRLADAVAASGTHLYGRHNFLGLDSDGYALVENRPANTVGALRPRAILLAVGAVERVLPRPGWHLPGVRTAGGMQVMLKETGTPPEGRILVAGSGPLTVALAAQLAAAGNPPVAVLEAGNPLRPGIAGLSLLRRPQVAFEAGAYLAALYRVGVPWLRGRRVTAIRQAGAALEVEYSDASGGTGAFLVDHLALNDGIRPNRFGLPEAADTPLVVHAGDCREALGAVAAEADGKHAALRVAAALSGAPLPAASRAVGRERAIQAALAALFEPPAGRAPAHLPDDTVLCRCEGRTVGDLRALVGRDGGLSPREIKLNGRFAMGACQGRFCADNVMALAAAMRGEAVPEPAERLTGRRWPVRPVSIASLIAGETNREPAPDDEPDSKTRMP